MRIFQKSFFPISRKHLGSDGFSRLSFARRLVSAWSLERDRSMSFAGYEGIDGNHHFLGFSASWKQPFWGYEADNFVSIIAEKPLWNSEEALYWRCVGLEKHINRLEKRLAKLEAR